ncbi:polysaccharide biosynthesis/export family protein [Pontibacter anaerobius]|uniref:Polysaccharide biosynthesis/export family protein n=1 Tax=Pontibacter anaerobius TaxID=2993940 RepID=A0ABT3RH68_9BACT|nr:polysaccharide biosynthesis/export family protein [Pontibacter anaerobius]MCX2740974.1 polysaccharide biosynthesis/export family protein [Pontibacter anaerobius]
MISTPLRKHIMYILITLCILTFTSCTNTKDAIYFSQIGNVEYSEFQAEDLEPVIQKNDLLSISVSSINPEATKIFNIHNLALNNSYSTANSTGTAAGYLVDQEGFILFPYLGKFKAAGLTKKSLREAITSELVDRRLLIEPIVDVRYINYKVSILGEVAKPSVITVPNEKITLLEALGLAGDLTIYANRSNILLIREEEGKKKLTRIDLTTDELFASPYYYLKSNDIIYVEPNKAKIQSTNSTRQWLPVILSGLSVAVIAVDRFIR